MNERALVDNLLAELALAVGTPLRLDEHGLLTLRLEEASCTLELPDDSDTLYLHVPIRHLPAAAAEPVLRHALARNLFTLAVPASWLALDPASGEILLCATVPVDGLTADDLALRLTALAGEAMELRASLGHDPTNAAAPLAELRVNDLPSFVLRG